MNKVYIVSSGQFSDYRIHAIFSTEENAKEFIEYNNKILKIKTFLELKNGMLI